MIQYIFSQITAATESQLLSQYRMLYSNRRSMRFVLSLTQYIAS